MFELYMPGTDSREPEFHVFETVAECEALGDEVAEGRAYSIVRLRDAKLVLISRTAGKDRFF